MAIKVITWVWEHSRSRNGARLVLLAIADAASENGSHAWPSINTLKKKANLSERAVQAAIKELVALGELRVGWNQGPHGSNFYTVIMRETPADSAPPQDLRPAESAGVETGTELGAIPQDPPQILHPADSAPPQILRQTPADSAPEPSLTRKSKKKTSSSSSGRTRGTRIPDDFAMTPEMIAWGRENFPALDGHAITAEFVDYWRGVPGAKGIKLDWTATWRNWIRRKASDQQRFGPAQNPPSKRTTGQQRLDDAARIAADMRTLDQAEATGQYQPPLMFALPPGRPA